MGSADPVSLKSTFFDRDVEEVARDLIGAELTVAGVGGIMGTLTYIGPTACTGT